MKDFKSKRKAGKKCVGPKKVGSAPGDILGQVDNTCG